MIEDVTVVCRQSKWFDVLIFFISNIAVHVATVPVRPGSTTWMETISKLFSLFCPYFGVGRAAILIARGAIWSKNPLQRAARSGALCIVTRTAEWEENTNFEQGAVVSKGEVSNTFVQDPPLADVDFLKAWRGMLQLRRIPVTLILGVIKYG